MDARILVMTWVGSTPAETDNSHTRIHRNLLGGDESLRPQENWVDMAEKEAIVIGKLMALATLERDRSV